MTDIKPKARWRLHLFHPIIILLMTLGALISTDIEFVRLSYLKPTLPIYLFITIIMYIPRIPLLPRLLLNLIAIFGYASWLSSVTPNDIKNVSKAIVFLIAVAPFLGYMLYIWTGYIQKFTKKLIAIFILLIIIASALQIPVAMVIGMFVSFLYTLFS